MSSTVAESQIERLGEVEERLLRTDLLVKKQLAPRAA
jgi:hypothetical protein